jgi:O-antigen/teichoic acid export membrane protein
VLQILLIAQFFLLGSNSAGGVLFGTGKHRIFAVWTLCEGAANLTLSALLVHWLGLFGVAWGTVIPSFVLSLFVRPVYVARMIGLPLRKLYWEGWLRPALACAPFAAALFWTAHSWVAHSLLGLASQIIAISPVLIVPAALMFRTEIMQVVRSRWIAPRRTAATA